MIFNQFFDEVSCTYTYLLSSGKGREALIIDPVLEKTNDYILFLKKLDLKLVKVIDTHIHADHVSGLKELKKQTDCAVLMGEQSLSEVVTVKVKDNENVAGFFELIYHKEKSEAEIAYFGLLKDYMVKKLGGHMLSEAIKISFSFKIKRLWVHTCSLDHKNALNNYLSRGMKIYNTETISVRSA